METFQPKSAVSTTSTVSGTFPDIPMYANTTKNGNFFNSLKGQLNNQKSKIMKKNQYIWTPVWKASSTIFQIFAHFTLFATVKNTFSGLWTEDNLTQGFMRDTVMLMYMHIYYLEKSFAFQ